MKTVITALALVLFISPFSASAVTVTTEGGVELEIESVQKTSINLETRAEANGDSAEASVDVEIMPYSESNDPNVLMSATGVVDEATSELGVFIGQVEANNTDVADVRTETDGKVEVEYNHRGRFLGIFPVTVQSRTVVENDEKGEVRTKVSMPWWSFFVTGVGKVRADVENRLNANTEIQAGLSADASTDSRMYVVRVVVSSLKATATLE